MIKRRYRDMVLFLLIVFLLPFLCIQLHSMTNNSSIQFILYGIEAASPTIAAGIVVSLNKRRKEFFVNLFHKKRLLKAVMLPFSIAAITMFLTKLIYCSFFNIDYSAGNIPLVQFVIISWAFIAEELGWRGYFEPFLKAAGVNKWLVPTIVGIVWCLWHYHFFILNGIQVPIILFFSGCIIESYIYSFLMQSTNNNLISAMTYHYAWNLCYHIFELSPADNYGITYPYIILLLLEVLVLLLFFLARKIQMRKSLYS